MGSIPSTPVVSVVIPCYNSGNVFYEMLDSLVAQTWGGPWEVIVADNGSTDHSWDIAESYIDKLPLRIVDASAVQGISHARNCGVKASSGRFLLFCDSDDVLDEGYVDAMVAALEEHPFVGGQVRRERVNAPWLQALKHTKNKTKEGLIKTEHLPFVGGCTIGIRREAFDAVGGFDESLLGLEDMDFSWRIQQSLGIRPKCVSEARLYYRARPTLWANFVQNHSYARCYYHAFWKRGCHEKIMSIHPAWYIAKWGYRLLKRLFSSVRSRGDFLLWIRQAAWRVGLAQAAWR